MPLWCHNFLLLNVIELLLPVMDIINSSVYYRATDFISVSNLAIMTAHSINLCERIYLQLQSLNYFHCVRAWRVGWPSIYACDGKFQRISGFTTEHLTELYFAWVKKEYCVIVKVNIYGAYWLISLIIFFFNSSNSNTAM